MSQSGDRSGQAELAVQDVDGQARDRAGQGAGADLTPMTGPAQGQFQLGETVGGSLPPHVRAHLAAWIRNDFHRSATAVHRGQDGHRVFAQGARVGRIDVQVSDPTVDGGREELGLVRLPGVERRLVGARAGGDARHGHPPVARHCKFVPGGGQDGVRRPGRLVP